MQRKQIHTRIFALALLVLASTWLDGVRTAQAAETSGYVLEIRPSICVSYDSELPCTMALAIRWRAPEPTAVCLREVDDIEPLHCWDAATSGTLELAYADTDDVVYELVTALDGRLLATADIKIINRDLRNSRTRRRHVWSIL